MKEWAKHFYKSKAWRQCRDAYFVYRHGLCERCQRPGKIVHHKIYLTPENINDPNISLNWEYVELLCATCHQHEHFMKNSPTRDDVMFDANGNLVKRNDLDV